MPKTPQKPIEEQTNPTERARVDVAAFFAHVEAFTEAAGRLANIGPGDTYMDTVRRQLSMVLDVMTESAHLHIHEHLPLHEMHARAMLIAIAAKSYVDCLASESTRASRNGHSSVSLLLSGAFMESNRHLDALHDDVRRFKAWSRRWRIAPAEETAPALAAELESIGNFLRNVHKGSIKTREIAERYSITRQAVNDRCSNLATRGLIENKKPGEHWLLTSKDALTVCADLEKHPPKK